MMFWKTNTIPFEMIAFLRRHSFIFEVVYIYIYVSYSPQKINSWFTWFLEPKASTSGEPAITQMLHVWII